MRNKLEGCPFCGKRPTVCRGGPGGIVWYIFCSRDGHNVSLQYYETRSQAIAEWNKRATGDAK